MANSAGRASCGFRGKSAHAVAGRFADGFRIPTEAMPWVAPDELAYANDTAPYADKVKLPSGAERHPELFELEPEPMRCRPLRGMRLQRQS